jgi:hypothetical protein
MRSFSRLLVPFGTSFLILFVVLLPAGPAPLLSQADEKSKAEKSEKKSDEGDKEGTTRLRIEVVAGEKDEPVDSASIYVRFVRARALIKDQKVEMNTKTNRSGVAVLPNVPRGKVAIQVIAPGWKTFGQWYDIDKAEQTVRIKLQKPPRWY